MSFRPQATSSLTVCVSIECLEMMQSNENFASAAACNLQPLKRQQTCCPYFDGVTATLCREFGWCTGGLWRLKSTLWGVSVVVGKMQKSTREVGLGGTEAKNRQPISQPLPLIVCCFTFWELARASRLAQCFVHACVARRARVKK